jgi:hypothetical protein
MDEGENSLCQAALMSSDSWRVAFRCWFGVTANSTSATGSKFGLKVMLDAFTRSIPDNGGDKFTLAADRSVTTPKNPRRKPTPL